MYAMSSVAKRFLSLSESQLRIIYSLIGFLSLSAIVASAVQVVRFNVVNSDQCIWQKRVIGSDSVLTIGTVADGGAVDQAGIREGDIVVSINGVPITGRYTDPNVAQEILNDAPTDRPIPYIVRRGDEVLVRSVQLVRQYAFISFLMPLFAFLWLLIGIIVVMARPSGALQSLFFLVSATVIFAIRFPFAPTEPGLFPLFIAWQLVGASFYPLWLLFCTQFPVAQQVFGTRAKQVLLFAPPLVSAVLLVTAIHLAVSNVGGFGFNATPLIVVAGFLIVTIYAAYFGLGVWFLFRGYRRMPATADRRPMRIILAGTVLAGLTLLYFVVLNSSVEGTAILYPQFFLPMLLLLALPISFGYVIFKYQLMDFKLVLKTAIIYTATMTLIAGFYLAIGYALGQVLGGLIGERFESAVEFTSIFLFLLLFEPVKRQVERGVENRFFPQYRDYSAELNDYSTRIAEVVGTDAVAELIARTLRDTLALHGVCVVVENGEGGLRVVARACDFGPLPVDDDAVLLLRRLLRESHDFIALENHDEPALEGLRSVFPFAVGMYVQGRPIGAILMSRDLDGNALSGSQMPFIRGVAAHGASALEAARLYEEEIARQRYREELATARRIQQSLLPAEMPKIPGLTISAISRPALAVGGDYYEVLKMDDNRFLVMIADVSGKGLPAALYMAGLHGMVRVACATHTSLKEILSTLNHHVGQIIARGSFITATLLLFDTERKTVGYARAGHTPIIRLNDNKIENLVPNGIALGLCATELFEELLHEYTIHYQPGDTYILYSDGVSEAMNVERKEFGEERLLQLVSRDADPSAEDLCEEIEKEVALFRGVAEQNDDITAVVIHVEREEKVRSCAGATEAALESSPTRTGDLRKADA